MHLLASYKTGSMRGVPNTLPPGLYEVASRKGPPRASTGSRPTSGAPTVPGVTQQFTGTSPALPQDPTVRQRVGTPLSAQSTGDGWIIGPADKARFDAIFAGLDKSNRGFVTGDQAVEFFGNARLPEEILAQIWDLADINSEGQLNRDEFAVAMFLIRQQRFTKDGRGNLPSILPPGLVPPSMRRQQLPPSQTTAPAFENTPVTQPRSAVDDLFGLDALTSPGQQVPQSTGSSFGGPFQSPKSPPPPATSSPATPTMFKPFVPSSSFGQTLQPQPYQAPSSAQPRSVPQQIPTSDDLLGDADPEVSHRLTEETTELANLSNQVGNLSKQMTELQGDRAAAEQELSQTTQQKREFEARLSQLRTMYEQEVKEVKVLQESLATARNEAKRLQQDMAVIDGSHQDLQTQHQQVAQALEADQRENAALKERIRQVNAEINQLKPQLEKLRSDARQQKGLVAINKKQLATNEAEKERVQNDMNDETREAEERERMATQVVVASPPPVASPAASTSSNPFFRRTATGTSETTFSPQPTSRETNGGQRSAFDNIFGPSFEAPSFGTPPTAYFKSETSGIASAPPSESRPAESRHLPSPLAPDSAIDSLEPPPPPQSDQITSAALPFRAPIERVDSISSSVQVALPASRISPASTPRAATPSASASSGRSLSGASPERLGQIDTNRRTANAGPWSDSDQLTPTTQPDRNPLSDESRPETNEREIPGAFPSSSFDTPRSQTPQHEVAPTAVAVGAGLAALAAGAGLGAATLHQQVKIEKAEYMPEPQPESRTNDLNSNFDQLLGGPAHSRSQSEQAADFDSAFATMKKSPTTNGDANTSNKEFPPIQEFGGDESDDSSEAPMAFDDDFNTSSPHRPTKAPHLEDQTAQGNPAEPLAVPNYLQAWPPLGTTFSTASSLPGISAQNSPPPYGEAAPKNDPSHFPPEFEGLLPSREDPTALSALPNSVPRAEASSSMLPSGNRPPAYGPEVPLVPPHESVAPAPIQSNSTPLDFDSTFASVDLAVAQVEESSDDDDFATPFINHDSNFSTAFDPSFGSPARPKGSTTTSQPTQARESSATADGSVSTTQANNTNMNNDFYNLVPSLNNSKPFDSTIASPAATTTNTSHDWDAIFAGLDTPAPAAANDLGSQSNPTQAVSAHNAATTTVKSVTHSPSPQQPLPASSLAATSLSATAQPRSGRPKPGRALSAGTEHDDPILKRLTAMGWGRDASLDALERFDYNIDKVRPFAVKRSRRPC